MFMCDVFLKLPLEILCRRSGSNFRMVMWEESHDLFVGDCVSFQWHCELVGL